MEIKSNEKIILTDNAFIYSKSPWKVGDNKGKVQITGKPDNFGGGIFILDSKRKSKFINTKFSYLSGLEKISSLMKLTNIAYNLIQNISKIEVINFHILKKI